MLSEFNWNEAVTTSPIFMALVLFSVVTLGVIVERLVYFVKRGGSPDELLKNVLLRISRGEIKEAAWECETSRHPAGAVALQAFSTRDRSDSSIEERFQITLSQQKLMLERNLNILGTMAAIAPLVGLLGTVWGIMRAFSDMAKVGSAGPSVVAAGVAEALVTTAAGLVVAVPALMLYNHFTRRTNVMLTVAENHGRSIRAALKDEETALVGSTQSERRAGDRTSVRKQVDKVINDQ